MTLTAAEILSIAKQRITTYLKDGDTLPVIVAVGDPKRVRIGISIQRNYPLTLIERSYGIPFGRFRSDAAQMLSVWPVTVRLAYAGRLVASPTIL